MLTIYKADGTVKVTSTVIGDASGRTVPIDYDQAVPVRDEKSREVLSDIADLLQILNRMILVLVQDTSPGALTEDFEE